MQYSLCRDRQGLHRGYYFFISEAMRPIPLDQMMRLKRQAKVREEKLRNQTSGDPAGLLPTDGEEDAGVAVDEHADTWGFSWMPAIEDFVEQAAKAAEQRDEEKSDCTDDDEGGAAESRARGIGRRSRSGSRDPGDRSGGGELPPGSSSGRSGRKRGRPQASGTPPWSPSSRTRAPRPPSYNETLLADKSFHNPHASETMADAFGILRPASFVLDVEADDRPWGGGAEAVAAAKAATAAAVNGDGVNSAGASGGGGGGEDDRNWFYDTVRDRQNRLWADTRVRKGVELARKGQHQAAIDTYTQALGMCPNHDDGLVARGAAFATTGRLRQAVQDLSLALSLNPRNDNASRYLKETRRRMERQDTRLSPGGAAAAAAAAAAVGNASRLEHRAGPSANDRLDLVRTPAGNAERDEASRAALGALLQDGAEGDALRKMRALLEEDQKKRKRAEGGGGGGRGGDGDGGGGSSSSRKKKSRKKDKKSSAAAAKSRRSSSSRHKKRDRREVGGGDEARYDSSSSSSGGGGGDAGDDSSAEAADARSSSSKSKKKKKKKKKQHHKHKKRSSAGSGNGVGGQGLSGVVSASLSAGGGGDSGDDAHPILQRKKHSLWG